MDNKQPAIAALKKRLGNNVHVIERNGRKITGRLVRVNGNSITLKQENGMLKTKALFTLLTIGEGYGGGFYGYPGYWGFPGYYGVGYGGWY